MPIEDEDKAERFLKEVLKNEKLRIYARAEPRIRDYSMEYIPLSASGTLNEWVGATFVAGDSSKVPYETSHNLDKYKCDLCGRGPVQLWRNNRADYDPPPEILCLWCLGDRLHKTLRGKMEDTEITIDTSFSRWVPAIPYNNQGEYLVMPHRSGSLLDGVEWWLGLGR